MRAGNAAGGESYGAQEGPAQDLSYQQEKAASLPTNTVRNELSARARVLRNEIKLRKAKLAFVEVLLSVFDDSLVDPDIFAQ